MFINLSNHRLSDWSEKQLEAAREYGELIDLVFPQEIRPEWDTDQVAGLVPEFFLKCVTLMPCPGAKDLIFLAGEPVFVFMLANQLLKAGYTVVSTTTNRLEYKFVRFRKYRIV